MQIQIETRSPILNRLGKAMRETVSFVKNVPGTVLALRLVGGGRAAARCGEEGGVAKVEQLIKDGVTCDTNN